MPKYGPVHYSEHRRSDSPFVVIPRGSAAPAPPGSTLLWIIVSVKFAQWTRDGALRHPSFDGVCEGMAPKSVVVEKSWPPDGIEMISDRIRAWAESVVRWHRDTFRNSG
jgi:hypothetical protein